MPDEPGRITGDVGTSALTELTLCESLAQVSAWTARGAARGSGADTALVWTSDPSNRLLICTGGSGDGARAFTRRSVGREDRIARDLIRDRSVLLLARAEFSGADPAWVSDAPAAAGWCLLLPLAVGREAAAGVLSLFFAKRPAAEAVSEGLSEFLRLAVPALERSLRAEHRTAGLLHAIERLTALYDLSKAFGSTIDWTELNAIVARKAVDFASAEAGSLWLLDAGAESVELAATAINESYEIGEPPAAVGAPLVGDLLADRVAILRNEVAADDPLAEENPGYGVRSVLAVALTEDDAVIGALVLVNKRGRVPEFSGEDQELLEDLARQAVRALRNARQYEAEKKVEELDALLAVSREITSTLDLDKVMQAIVNATSALVAYDRCAISIMDRGRLRLGAVSGMATLDRHDADVRRTEALLQWVFLSGADVNVTLQGDGTIAADRPETEEKFRAHFEESGLRSFLGVLLKDEEGKLGVLGFECRDPILFDPETRDLLQILVNQATVAVRNAQLYQQVPLAGFLKPLIASRRKLLELPRGRRVAWMAAAIAVLLLLFVPWRFRIGGPARIQPGRQSVVTAGVDGIVSSVVHREGDVVARGEVIASIQDESYRAALADAISAFRIAESDVARYQDAGAASAMHDAESRREELSARIALERDRLERTRLTAAVSGVILTPHLEERVGQNLARGAEFCVVADVHSVTAEVAVPEGDAAFLAKDQTAYVKLNPYPSRTFPGRVLRVGARIREEGEERFVLAEVQLENPDGILKTGMVGRGKIVAGRRPIAALLFRKPARWLYSRLWPLLP